MISMSMVLLNIPRASRSSSRNSQLLPTQTSDQHKPQTNTNLIPRREYELPTQTSKPQTSDLWEGWIVWSSVWLDQTKLKEIFSQFSCVMPHNTLLLSWEKRICDPRIPAKCQDLVVHRVSWVLPDSWSNYITFSLGRGLEGDVRNTRLIPQIILFHIKATCLIEQKTPTRMFGQTTKWQKLVFQYQKRSFKWWFFLFL